MNRGLLNMIALFTNLEMNCHCLATNGVRAAKYAVLWDFFYFLRMMREDVVQCQWDIRPGEVSYSFSLLLYFSGFL